MLIIIIITHPVGAQPCRGKRGDLFQPDLQHLQHRGTSGLFLCILLLADFLSFLFFSSLLISWVQSIGIRARSATSTGRLWCAHCLETQAHTAQGEGLLHFFVCFFVSVCCFAYRRMSFCVRYFVCFTLLGDSTYPSGCFAALFGCLVCLFFVRVLFAFVSVMYFCSC